jgi:hypothetical protein
MHSCFAVYLNVTIVVDHPPMHKRVVAVLRTTAGAGPAREPERWRFAIDRAMTDNGAWTGTRWNCC